MRRSIARHAYLAWSVAIGAVLIVSSACLAADGVDDPPPSYQSQSEIRSGGVLAESYQYHRQSGMRPGVQTIEPASGWYGYGFPVRTFRWGWFGAEHYYPYTMWHDGYCGDCCRYAYRRGY